jgi:uncharacterized protein
MRKSLLLLFYLIGFLSYSRAKDIPSKPNPPRLVNDYAGVLSRREQGALEQKLVAYFDTTSTQIAIVIEQSLDGDDLFDYCQRLATAWGIGEKGKSNGVLLYVAISDRKVRIHTGYGMEGVLPDARSSRIINQRIKPNFKAANYYAGLDEATSDMIAAASGEYKNDREPEGKNGLMNLAILLGVIIIFFVIFKGKGGGGRGGQSMVGPLFWGTLGSHGFSSGSGWGGGSSSGGFGGFGGGSFGGGGSSGSW